MSYETRPGTTFDAYQWEGDPLDDDLTMFVGKDGMVAFCDAQVAASLYQADEACMLIYQQGTVIAITARDWVVKIGGRFLIVPDVEFEGLFQETEE